MKLFARRVPRGLIAADAASEDAMSKILVGKTVKLEVKQPRNIQHHRLYFSLVNLLFDNQEQFKTVDELHACLKVMAGVCTPIKMPDDSIAYVPGSIDFEHMDQAKFNEFFEHVCKIVFEHIIPGLKSEEIKAQIDAMINPQQQAAE